MTVQEFFRYLGDHPNLVVGYFALLPLLAWILGGVDRDRGHQSPWRYLYSGLIYLSAVPGIFSLTLNVYLFLFERMSVMSMDIFTQILPILSMILTLGIIRKNVDMDYIPGFDKLSGLLMLIAAVIGLMWLADRTRIVAIFFMPFWVVALIFIGLLIVIRFGYTRVFGAPYREEM